MNWTEVIAMDTYNGQAQVTATVLVILWVVLYIYALSDINSILQDNILKITTN